MVTLILDRPRSTRASAAAVGSGAVSAGTCHAPHTTTIRSYSRAAARSAWRIHASRRSSSPSKAASPASPAASARTAVIASAIAANGRSAAVSSSSSPGGSKRCSTTSSHQRSASS
jgi:hypothetical protein